MPQSAAFTGAITVHEGGQPMADQRLLEAMKKTGEWKLVLAFRSSTFVYGTRGTGSYAILALKSWAARPRTRHPSPDGRVRRVVERELNLFDPGPRADTYLKGDYQMMDMYYGQAGTTIDAKRIPVIAEFVHNAMGFTGEFSMKQSGRDAYMKTFKTSVEGWDDKTPCRSQYDGLTATQEMSRIIRWGIDRFGGTIIFEGRQIYYSQVFDPASPRVGDTDMEAQDLFRAFSPGMSAVPTANIGRGRIKFFWCGREVIPTQLHFISNWSWAGGKTHLFHNMKNFNPRVPLRPIWNNFIRLPKSLAGEDPEQVVKALDE